MLRFFLSRAAGDDDSYAMRFFRDLSAKVRELARVDGDVGFVEADSHASWSAAAQDALATCRVFVALCSPRYFLTERCGREWWIFADRLRRYEEVTDRRAPAIIPVLWSGESATDGRPASPGDDEALRHLIRLRSLRPRYEAYLAALARQIVTSAETHDIPRSSPGLDPTTAPNAFAYADPGNAGIQTPSPRALAGAATQRVHFVVAAGNRAEMGTIRNDLRYYGDHGQDWAPYRPAAPDPLITYARMVAAERLFGSEIADLENLPARLDQAHQNNEIVVLLVDSWITKLSAYRQMLTEFDGRGDSTVAVLAPANTTDLETLRHRGELRAQLTSTFPYSLARGDQLVHTDIDSAESFEADLVVALEEVQNRIFSHGRVFRRPPDDEPTDRPILQGP